MKPRHEIEPACETPLETRHGWHPQPSGDRRETGGQDSRSPGYVRNRAARNLRTDSQAPAREQPGLMSSFQGVLLKDLRANPQVAPVFVVPAVCSRGRSLWIRQGGQAIVTPGVATFTSFR